MFSLAGAIEDHAGGHPLAMCSVSFTRSQRPYSLRSMTWRTSDFPSLNDASTQPLRAICQPLALLLLRTTRTLGLTTGDDDDEQEHDDAHDDPDPHLHVLPPHLLADAVGAATEALGGLVQVLGFVLELVDVLAALGDGFEILFHDVDGVVDLLKRREWC